VGAATRTTNEKGALAYFVGGVSGAYQRSQHLEARRKLATAWGKFALGAKVMDR
jgi:hypothetical protein